MVHNIQVSITFVSALKTNYSIYVFMLKPIRLSSKKLTKRTRKETNKQTE